MSNINSVFNEQISRVARREIRKNTKVIKKSTSHYRRDIAALKRQMAGLLKQIKSLQKQGGAGLSPLPPADGVGNARLRVDGMKSHRRRLGLSAEDYGKLLGVSKLTVYSWESGKRKPRRSQLPQILAVRGIGKREAMERLGVKPTDEGRASRGRRRRGVFKRTGVETILALVGGGKTMSTAEINDAWRKEGRGGTADVLLGKLVAAKELKRTKVKGVRGSTYTAA